MTKAIAKVHKAKIFSRPCILLFVSGVQQESVLLDFISQNKVKILLKVKTCQNCLYQQLRHKKRTI